MSGIGRRPKSKSFGKQQPPGLIVCPRCAGASFIAPDAISIGNRMKACRDKLGCTQAEIAPLLKISRAQLANLEGDRSRPGIETLVLAADAFGVSVDYLLGRP
jgi:DNA-binding XRE family transcriptional regulator